MEGAKKTKTNPAFKSKYADLEAIWEAAREPLTTNGFSVLQVPTTQGATLTVTTRLLHASGEWVEDDWSMTARAASPQALMSCLTYARRGALAAFVRIAPEDDDGETAQGRGEYVDRRTGEVLEAPKPTAASPAKPSPAPPAEAKTVEGGITDAQQRRFFKLAKDAGWRTDEIKAELKKRFDYDHTHEITWRRYDDICDYFTHGPATDDAPPNEEPNDGTLGL